MNKPTNNFFKDRLESSEIFLQLLKLRSKSRSQKEGFIQKPSYGPFRLQGLLLHNSLQKEKSQHHSKNLQIGTKFTFARWVLLCNPL